MAPIANQNSEQDHNHHNIVEVASDTDNLSTLVAAVQAAGLVETLSGDGPFTVFAPTNEAFDALPDGTLESLLEPANRDMLVKILTYHVVSGEVMAGDLSDGMMAETVQGSNISISIANGTVSINDATVIAADVDASNGVVHVIDSVIMPPEEESSSY
ncbi:fasciclin domain-containing protein [Rhodohalobacter sp. 8-1]